MSLLKKAQEIKEALTTLDPIAEFNYQYGRRENNPQEDQRGREALLKFLAQTGYFNKKSQQLR